MIVKSGMAGFEIPQNVDSTELRVVVDVIVGTVAMPYRMQFLFASGPEVFPPDLRESPGMFTPL